MIGDPFIYAGNGIRLLRVDRTQLAACPELRLLNSYLAYRATMVVLIVTNA
jgi:hypothetical protein